MVTAAFDLVPIGSEVFHNQGLDTVIQWISHMFVDNFLSHSDQMLLPSFLSSYNNSVKDVPRHEQAHGMSSHAECGPKPLPNRFPSQMLRDD